MDKPTDPSVTHDPGPEYPIRSRLDSDDVTRLGAYAMKRRRSKRLRAERDQVRERVAEMLEQLEALDL